MTKRGYPASKLKLLNDARDVLTTTDSVTSVATGAAQESTAERNAAYKALRDFVNELRGAAAASPAKTPTP